jgi:cytochrome P450
MSTAEIEGNSSLFIVAGSETTATLLSGATYYLLKNPNVLEKLKAEVRGHFKSEEEINVVNSGQLPYLFAVLEESLRMYPPVPTRLPRVTGPEGHTIDGHYVPPNVSTCYLFIYLFFPGFPKHSSLPSFYMVPNLKSDRN